MRLARALLPLAAAALAAPLARAAAQVPRKPIPPSPTAPAAPLPAPGGAARDTTQPDTGKVGRGAGLPTRPSRSFEAADSVETELMNRAGFRVLRYSADSVQFLPRQKVISLTGRGLLEREGSTLEADSVRYEQTNCALTAHGKPQLFDATGVVVGGGMLYDACNHAGIIARATTDFKEGSGTWYLRGDIAVDNQEDRTYAAGANITSCDLPDPHYHFAAKEVKWISKSVMVARPAVLYVADVPVMWLPFIFQDMRRGRRSGLIPPQFGLSDIVRNSPTYHRHISNLGWYWVLGDYADAEVTTDWYAQNFLTLNARVRYRWLDRFLSGGLAFQDLHQFNGSTSTRISWSHVQDFSLNSHLTANIDYATSSSVISRNAMDPVLAVSTIDSRLNFSQRFSWGMLNVGGSRSQSLDKPQVNMTLPTLSFTPNPISFGESVTWTPSFSLTNSLQSQVAAGFAHRSPTDSSEILADIRSTQISFGTPIRFGRWTWSNSFSVNDQFSTQPGNVTIVDPTDTTRRLVRTYGQSFETDVDWSTGISLPMLYQGTWNLQPSVNIVNTTGGAFMVKNRFSHGRYVTQGKRLQYSLSIAPTFFGLFGGIGPIARIRHSFSPSIAWSYSPSANIPVEYARAVAGFGGIASTKSPATQLLTFGLTQAFEAKLKPPRSQGAGADTTRADTTRADTTGAAGGGQGARPGGQEEQLRKVRLLSIQTSGLAIDLEQAKRPGRTGWTTGTISNTFSSDLLQGFSLSTTHDLFKGPVGYHGTRFSPSLTSVSARFSLGPNTIGWLASLFGIGGPPQPSQARRDTTRQPGDTLALPTDPFLNAYQRGPLQTHPTALGQMAPRGTSPQFNASLAFDLSRPSALYDTLGNLVQAAPPPHSTINASVSFSPTRHWTVSWATMYDFQKGQFGSHVLRLDRDLHDWRATFSFVQAPNGNVAFNFNITLIDQPEIKFDYDQRTMAVPQP